MKINFSVETSNFDGNGNCNFSVKPRNFDGNGMKLNLPVEPRNFDGNGIKGNFSVEPRNFDRNGMKLNFSVEPRNFDGNKLNRKIIHKWRKQATEKVFWAYFLGWVQLQPIQLFRDIVKSCSEHPNTCGGLTLPNPK